MSSWQKYFQKRWIGKIKTVVRREAVALQRTNCISIWEQIFVNAFGCIKNLQWSWGIKQERIIKNGTYWLRFHLWGENWWFSKEFKHLRKIHDINDLCPASSSIEITANVDLSYDESALPDLGSIDLSESSESSDGWDGLPDTAAWDALAKTITNLLADRTRMKEMKPVDSEVNTLHICIFVFIFQSYKIYGIIVRVSEYFGSYFGDYWYPS